MYLREPNTGKTGEIRRRKAIGAEKSASYHQRHRRALYDVFYFTRYAIMDGYWTIKETSEKWNLSIRRITTLCNEGRLEGAIRFGSVWAIPAGTKKPKDERIKSGKYIKKKAE